MKRRAYRGKPPAAAGAVSSMLILLAGLLAGAGSKWADLYSVFWAEATSHIALWILLASAVALGSRSPARAALHVLLFLGGMVAAYYAAAELLHTGWSESFLIGWGAAALLSPIAGWLVWHARGTDRLACLLSAGVLAAQLGASVLLYGGLGLTDLAVVVLTAVLLFWNKVNGWRKTRNRRRRR